LKERNIWEQCKGLGDAQAQCLNDNVLGHGNATGALDRSNYTEDAGLYLTHLVKARWARGLKTSVIAFDIMQFFPSLNHGMLMAILR
jgi:hypothetical protein